jgi:hypothetical protein
MRMPKVSKCAVKECAYNKKDMCHAAAITVGGPQPCCDTFAELAHKGGIEDTGVVGACKVDNCRYNEKLGCSAKTIEIARRTCDADCLTFEGV